MCVCSTAFVTVFTNMSLRGLIVFCIVGVSLTASSHNAKHLSKGNEKLTRDLFAQIRSNKGNLFFSPLSIEILLALTHAGTSGRCAEQIRKAAHLPESRDKSAALYGELMETLKSDDSMTLHLANAIFADKQFSIKQCYRDIAKHDFKANVNRVEFSRNNEAAEIINRYVARKTHDKITELVSSDSLDASTRLILLNAIYFKADWQTPFPKQDTRKQIFHINSNKAKKVDFMRIQKVFPATENKDLDAKIVKIPYNGKTVSMVLIVPNSVNGIHELESKIACSNLKELTKNLNSQDVTINMPKFKLEETLDLTEILPKMGITDIFTSGRANFSRISDENLYVSNALQKAVIDVNEEGTEAAAASFVDAVASTFPLPLVINADRPFIFFIYHNPTGQHLFMGRVSSPPS